MLVPGESTSLLSTLYHHKRMAHALSTIVKLAQNYNVLFSLAPTPPLPHFDN